MIVGEEEVLTKWEAQFLHARKLDTVGKFTGGIAHDFNNVLAVIRNYAEILREDLEAENRETDLVDEIAAAAARGEALTRRLLACSRRQVSLPSVISIDAVLVAMERLLRRIIGDDIELVLRCAPNLRKVKIDPDHLEQVIMNLVVNARHAMPHGGQLKIEASNTSVGFTRARSHPGIMKGKYVLIAVSDTGLGMDEETRRRAFEPFFTTKECGKGTGLGLSTVYGIVTQSGGDIRIDSEPGRGTCLAIYFPSVEAPMPPRDPRVP